MTYNVFGGTLNPTLLHDRHLRPSVYLFVRSITQKQMILKCSDLVLGMIFGYT